MQKLFFHLVGLIPVLYPASAVLADAPPPAAAQAVIIFHEDFQDSVVGQTARPGYWTTSTRGPGRVINWMVEDIGPLEPDMVFRGRGMSPWEGEWRTETIDISSYREAEISIDVYSDIYSTPENNCYVYFFYQTDTGDPVIWFSQTGSLAPERTFLRKTSPPVHGENLVFSFRASTEDATGDNYLFRRVLVTGIRPSPDPGTVEQDYIQGRP